MSPLQRLLKHPAGDLLLPAGVLKELHTHGWNSYPTETGGVLLGLSDWSKRVAVVTDVVGPGPDATHGATRFEPDHEWQAAEVAARWHQDPRLEYLGDWHTHPDGSATPSKLDKTALETIAAAPDAQQPRPLMLILALKESGTAVSSTWFSGVKFESLRLSVLHDMP